MTDGPTDGLTVDERALHREFVKMTADAAIHLDADDGATLISALDDLEHHRKRDPFTVLRRFSAELNAAALKAGSDRDTAEQRDDPVTIPEALRVLECDVTEHIVADQRDDSYARDLVDLVEAFDRLDVIAKRRHDHEHEAGAHTAERRLRILELDDRVGALQRALDAILAAAADDTAAMYLADTATLHGLTNAISDAQEVRHDA